MFILPSAITERLMSLVFDFLKKSGESLARDMATKKQISEAIEGAASRFGEEFEDKGLARVLTADTRFYDLESVQSSIDEILKHPFDPAPQVKIEKEFEMVLPESQRGLAGKAAQTYLEILREQLIGVEKLNDKLKLIYLKQIVDINREIKREAERGANAGERSADALEKLADSKDKHPNLEKAREIYLHKFIEKYSPKSSSPIDLGNYEDLPLMPFFSSSNSSNENTQTPKRYKRLSDIPDLPNVFVLSGPHGSGKTILLRKRALENANIALQNINEPLPILIEAWEWQSGDFFSVLINNLRKYLFSAAKSLSPMIDPNDLILQGAALYFDGLDELGQERFVGLTKTIGDLDTKTIATYRVDEYKDKANLDFREIAILPLESENIRHFAQTYLGREKSKAFIGQFESLQEEREKHQEKDLMQLIRIPFFLNIILDNYKESGGVQVANQWKLIENCVNRLLRGFDERLGVDRSEIKQYRNTSDVIDLLSDIAFKSISHRFVPLDKISSHIPKAVLRALDEVGLIILDTERVRFRHDLIAEFFAAHQLINANLEPVVRRRGFEGVLVLLASYSEKHQEDIQRIILKSFDGDVSEEKDRGGSNWGRDRIMNDRGLLWLLGEIGNIDVAKWLLSYISNRKSDVDIDVLVSLAKIVGRLPSEQDEKRETAEIIGKKLSEKPNSLTDDRFSWWNHGIREQVGVAGSYIDLAKALAEIKTNDAARYLVEGLFRFADLFQEGMAPGMFDIYRREFSLAFSKMGEPAVQHLLELLSDGNEEIAITAGEALAWTLTTVPPKLCYPILARHPLAEVRFQIASALGEQLHPESIPYLINALNDEEVITRGTAGHHGGMWSQYFYVRDGASLALAKFDSAEARAALQNHGYSENGMWTLEMWMERLDENIEEPARGALSRQWARFAAGEKGGLELLLPRLGHMEHAPDLPCPIADGLRERIRIGERPTESLLQYFHESGDRISQMESILLVGEMGDKNTAFELLKVISSKLDEDLRAATAGSLAVLVARHIKSYSPEEVVNFENALITAINFDNVDGSKSLGYGLGRVAFAILSGDLFMDPLARLRTHRNIDLSARKLVQLGVERAIERIENGTISGIKVGLKILEEVAGALEGFDVVEKSYIEDVLEGELAKKARAFLESIPNYKVRCAINALFRINYKQGSFDLVPERGTGNFPRREYYVQEASRALKLLKKAQRIKSERHPVWAKNFQDQDWDELGCDDGTIYSLMGYAARCVKQNDDAIQYWTRCSEFYESKENLVEKEKSRLAHVLLDLSNLIIDDKERVYKYAEQALVVAQNSTNPLLRFEALGNLEFICRERGDWKRIIEISRPAIHISRNIPHLFREKSQLLLTRALAYLEMQNYQAALDDYEEGLRFTEQYGLLKKSIEFRMGIIIAHSHVIKSKEFSGDSHLLAIIRFYDDTQDWVGGAWAMIFIADRAYLNLKDQYNMYRLAAECGEKIGPTMDGFQVMSYVMPKLAELWKIHEQEDNRD
ncbi:MAG: hypothetical protein IT315_11260 [Anaerolineales bacterium]|nr:hypothetical protein [Anaerolineales bacterium]